MSGGILTGGHNAREPLCPGFLKKSIRKVSAIVLALNFDISVPILFVQK